jgi:probable HAF family extracellular repeat protein
MQLGSNYRKKMKFTKTLYRPKSSIAAALLLFLASPVYAQKYNLSDLGTLGGFYSTAYGINSAGKVVGISLNTGNATYSATAWNERASDLGTLGGSVGVAASINDAGDVVGYSTTTGNWAQRATLWRNGVASDLGTLGGTLSQAKSINNAGIIAGESWNADNANIRATVWDNGKVIELEALGGTSSQASDINDLGHVVGYAQTAVGPDGVHYQGHATLWVDGVAIDLGTLGGSISVASAINNSGAIVGYSSANFGGWAHAALWDNGSIFDLSSNFVESEALDINASGQIVGRVGIPHGNVSFNGNGYWESRAALWNGTNFTDLNSTFGDTSAGFSSLNSATSINSKGQIVGYGTMIGGNIHAFMLSPVSVPEPASICLLVSGLGAIAFVVRRRKAKIPTHSIETLKASSSQMAV